MDLNLSQLGPLWIGIDQSYSGFGLTRLQTDSWEQDLLKFPSVGSDASRLNHIYNTLHVFFSLAKPVHRRVSMAMEGYAHNAKFGREKAGELGGIVKLAWYDVFRTDPMVVSPTVLKKYVTGKGNANKQEMMAGVARKWQVYDIVDDNLADSFALAQYLKEYE